MGRAIEKYTKRDDVVLATKLFNPMHDGPGGSGLSRKAIMEQIDVSLTRLDTDYVDLYHIRLKARLRSMRGVKSNRPASVVVRADVPAGRRIRRTKTAV